MDTQIDRHTDRHTDRHDQKHYLPTYTGGNYHLVNLEKLVEWLNGRLATKQFASEWLNGKSVTVCCQISIRTFRRKLKRKRNLRHAECRLLSTS